MYLESPILWGHMESKIDKLLTPITTHHNTQRRIGFGLSSKAKRIHIYIYMH